MSANLGYAVALCVSLALAGRAMAQGVLVPQQRAPARPSPQRQLMDALGLTPLQRRQLNEMRRSRRDEQTRVNNAIKELRRELADMYRLYPLDAARANAMIQQITSLEAERLRLQLQNQIDLRRILTREQFMRFSQFAQTSRRPATPAPGPLPGL
jgi:Spy/CpxP family protein refolding chaperone